MEIRLKSGDEQDCFTRWRKAIGHPRSGWGKVKRAYRKRVRRMVKQEIKRQSQEEGNMIGVEETITVTRKGKWYFAKYSTLDIVAQGNTMEQSLINLLWSIQLIVDHAVEHGKLSDLVSQKHK